jgi:hypothetical protein
MDARLAAALQQQLAGLQALQQQFLQGLNAAR